MQSINWQACTSDSAILAKTVGEENGSYKPRRSSQHEENGSCKCWETGEENGSYKPGAEENGSYKPARYATQRRSTKNEDLASDIGRVVRVSHTARPITRSYGGAHHQN